MPLHKGLAPLSQEKDLGIIQFVTENCVQQIKVTEDYHAQVCREMTLDRRLTLLFESTAITIHAFPCQSTELLGEEIEFRLLRTVESCILPLLAVVTDEDLLHWLSPRQQ